jgi:hypothetical protein
MSEYFLPDAHEEGCRSHFSASDRFELNAVISKRDQGKTKPQGVDLKSGKRLDLGDDKTIDRCF